MLKLILVMVLLQNCSRSIFNRPTGDWRRRGGANVRKEDRIIDALEPILNQHRLVVDVASLTGTTSPTKTKPRKKTPCTCSSIRWVACVKRRGPSSMTTDSMLLLKASILHWLHVYISSRSCQPKKTGRLERHAYRFNRRPQGSANHLVLGMDKDQRQKARGNAKNGLPTWFLFSRKWDLR